MSELLVPGIGILGVLVGALVVWLLVRSRTAAQLEAAVSKAEAGFQGELVLLRERVRAADETRQVEQASHSELKRQVEDLRDDLDDARDDAAKLTERASRVPALEAEISGITEQLRLSGQEVLRSSTEAAQKGQAVTLLTTQFNDLEMEAAALSGKLALASTALNAANERKAALEEQTARLPLIEGKLAQVEQELAEVSARFAELRESGGAQISRLTAEVAAEREALALVREELARVKVDREASDAEVNRIAASLNAANERKAALEEQVIRVPALEGKLARVEQELADMGGSFAELRETGGAQVSKLTAEVAAEREAHALARGELARVQVARESADAAVNRLNGELTEMRTRLESERDGAAEKIILLLQAKEALTDQFKSLANDILEEKSKRFAEQNQVTLGQLLDPLKTQLTEFKGKVEEVYVQEGKDRSALSEQVRQLVGLNQALSQDAKNLTLALKGSAKTQGNWGELVLERVLEASGLRKSFEYHVQESQTREDGTRAQADVIINLPEERRLVVDAKVSLVAYEQHIIAETDEDRALAVRRHLDSVRTHIKGLSGKQYQTLYGLKSLDFVLMFVPIEPAFMMAVTHDNDLFMDAWDRNVLLVSPSTLLFVVRTVAHLWRQEAQSRNAQDIAKRGAELYDRLVGFVEDLQTVGTRLSQAQTAYDSAHKKLSTGKGNVIRQAEILRGLGVKPNKALPSPLVEGAADPEELSVVEGLATVAGEDSARGLALGGPSMTDVLSK